MKITGKIEKVVYSNEDYHVCLITTSDKSYMTTINQPDIKVDLSVNTLLSHYLKLELVLLIIYYHVNLKVLV